MTIYIDSLHDKFLEFYHIPNCLFDVYGQIPIGAIYNSKAAMDEFIELISPWYSYNPNESKVFDDLNFKVEIVLK